MTTRCTEIFRTVLTLSVAITLALNSLPVLAQFYGAIAYSQSTGRIGSCKGHAHSRYQAERDALKNCGARDAKIWMWAKDKWISIAISDDVIGTAGFAHGASAHEAQSKALEICQDYAKGGGCHVAMCFHASGRNATQLHRLASKYTKHASTVESKSRSLSSSFSWHASKPPSTYSNSGRVHAEDKTRARGPRHDNTATLTLRRMTTAIQKAPTDRQVYLDRAQELIRLKKAQLAVLDLTRAIELSDQHDELLEQALVLRRTAWLVLGEKGYAEGDREMLEELREQQPVTIEEQMP